MKPTFNDKLIAYLVLFSGLAISGVAEYYSIMGLMAIYPTAIIPIVIMGVVLGIGKISGTVWLKQNWEWAPFFLKAYVLPAIVVLMLITSLGVFGYLSKAHSDQSLVSGDVQSKIAVYDTKIQTAKDNIDANRKALKQMDEAVDQVMGRSTSETGADKAVAIRRSQQKERSRLQSEIASEQKTIASINEERAPIAAEVRKVEAEVGPIKYIAHLLYGENPDANILEKAVIWVTVLIVIVLDPLAVVLLLASQYSFQRFREIEEKDYKDFTEDGYLLHKTVPAHVTDIEESPSDTEIVEDPEVKEFFDRGREVAQRLDAGKSLEGIPGVEYKIVEEEYEPDYIEPTEPEPEKSLAEQHPYLNQPFVHFKDMKPLVHRIEEPAIEPAPMPVPTGDSPERPGDYVEEKTIDYDALPTDQEYIVVDGHNMHIRAAKGLYKQTPSLSGYVQNEEQGEDTKWSRVISEAEYRDQASKLANDNKNNPDNTA